MISFLLPFFFVSLLFSFLYLFDSSFFRSSSNPQFVRSINHQRSSTMPARLNESKFFLDWLETLFALLHYIFCMIIVCACALFRTGFGGVTNDQIKGKNPTLILRLHIYRIHAVVPKPNILGILYITCFKKNKKRELFVFTRKKKKNQKKSTTNSHSYSFFQLIEISFS